MARFLVALFAATVMAVQAGGQLGHAAPSTSTADVFWRAVLPGSPLPDAILRLLRPAGKRRSSEDDFGYDDYRKDPKKRGAGAAATRAGDPHFNNAYEGSGKRRPGAAAGARGFDDDYSGAEKRRGTVVGEPPFLYAYKAPGKSQDGERRAPIVGEPPFLYAYKAPGKSQAGERRGTIIGEPPFLYAYKAPSKSQAAERRGTIVGEPPFLYAYKAPSKHQAGGERRGAIAGDSPFGYDYKAPSKNQAGGERRGAIAGDSPFGYDYKAPSKSHAGSGASGGESKAATTTVFFHEEAVRVGERLQFHFPPAATSAFGFLPRRVADSIPFTTAALPRVLAMLGVAPDSAMIASMEATLRTCESPTIAGESMFCATSLEALVERAMAVLGTRDVRPLTSTLPSDGAPLQAYTVRAVRPVEGGPSFVACHDEAYPYTVYRCHTTGPARAYMVEMEGARAGAVTVATVCHTDTSRWNPKHVSFRFLGTKPGGAPVCHLMPYGHIIWAKNVKSSPA